MALATDAVTPGKTSGNGQGGLACMKLFIGNEMNHPNLSLIKQEQVHIQAGDHVEE